MPISPALFFAPMLAHVWWVIFLYVCLGVARKKAVRSGAMAYKEFTPNQQEPLAVARLSRHLSNQFELPVLFYVLATLLMLSGGATMLDVALAWGFVVARVLHSAAATLSNRISPRSAAFALGVLVLVAMAGRLTWLVATH